MKNVLLLYILCTFFCGVSLAAGNKQHDAELLMRKTQEALYSNPSQAGYYAEKIIELFPEDQPNDLKAEAYYHNSQAEKFLGNFGVALKHLYDAQECITPQNFPLQAYIHALMGSLYNKLTDYNKAIEMNEKAISAFKSMGDSLALAHCYNDRGIIHYSMNEFHTAEQFLKQALAINRNQNNLRGIAANLNNLCLYEGDFNEKIQYIREAISINRKLDLQWSLGENYNNMGKQYFYARQYDKALQSLQQAYQVAHAINARELIADNHEYSSWVYEALGKHREAYQSLLQLFELNKDLQNSSKLRIVEQEIAQKRYLSQQRKAELREKAYEIELLKRNEFMLAILVCSLLLIALIVYKWYKRRKNMQLMEARYNLEQSEHELAELKVKQQEMKVRQQEMELQATQQALNNSQQEAISFAVFLQSRNEMLEKIREQIKDGYKMEPAALLLHLKKVNAFIYQCQSSDKSATPLLQNVEEKIQAFLNRLDKQHPNLTHGERHLATLLLVNLSTKEIAMLTGNVPKTVNMNRYRLRKALGLSAEEDLTDYLQSL